MGACACCVRPEYILDGRIHTTDRPGLGR
jgi:hypothetical protein